MADAGNTGTAGDKDSKGNVTINNNFAGANIDNLGNLLRDNASQTTNLSRSCSPPQQLTTAPPSALAPRKSATFVIEGSIKDLTPTELARLQAFVESLRKRTGDVSLTVTEFSEGSIRLALEGSEEGMAKLQELVEAGELSEILDRPLRKADFSDAETTEGNIGADPIKAVLLEKLRSGKADFRGVNTKGSLFKAAAALVGATLVGATLGGVDLSTVILVLANLSGANLSKANLASADLSGADLSEADLSGANLSGANLSGANLSGTNLRDAKVEGAIFSDNRGLSELARADLKRRGAIFEDSPGDRSEVLSPAPVPR